MAGCVEKAALAAGRLDLRGHGSPPRTWPATKQRTHVDDRQRRCITRIGHEPILPDAQPGADLLPGQPLAPALARPGARMPVAPRAGPRGCPRRRMMIVVADDQALNLGLLVAGDGCRGRADQLGDLRRGGSDVNRGVGRAPDTRAFMSQEDDPLYAD